MEEKLDRILLLLEDENIGLCSRVKSLEKTVNGNGAPGLSEKVRSLQTKNAKQATYISGGISLLSIPLWEYLKHKIGW